MRYLVWATPELICYHCFTCSVPNIFPKCKLKQKYPMKVVPNQPAQTGRGLQWLKTAFQLPDNSTTNSYFLIPNKEEWSYRRKTISNKQSNKILHHSCASSEQLVGYTIMQHLLQAFHPKQCCMAKQGHDCFVSRITC